MAEENENNDAYYVLLSKHNGKPYKQFNNPTNEGDYKKNNLKKPVLAVKPFIK